MLLLLAACTPETETITVTETVEVEVDCDTVYFMDADGDGHGDPDGGIVSCDPQPGLVDNAGDCDDLDATVHPGGVEVCDGADNDCDGEYDEDSDDRLTFYEDADGDGFGAAEVLACELPEGHVENADDCDDTDPWVSPDADEVCDSIDNDCDGVVDFDGWIPTDHATLADALDAVPGGAHFCIDEGTHTANGLSYEGALTLEGLGSDSVVLDVDGQFLDIEGDLEISGVHLTNIWSEESGSTPGIDQERGAVALEDVEISDVDSSEYATSSALLLNCYWDCDLTLRQVDIHDVTWTHDYDSGLPAGQLLNAWGGDVVIEDLSISNLTGEAYYWQTQVSTWAIGTMTVSGLELTDVEVTVQGEWGGYVGSPLALDAAGPIDVEDVRVSGLDITMEGDDWSYSRASAPFFGGASSDIGQASLRRIEITDNQLISSGEITTVYGVGLAEYSPIEVENLVMARNVVEGVGTVYGALFYGRDLELRNADFVDNFVSGTTLYGAMYSYGDTLSVTNTSFVSNVIEAESADSAAWGVLVGSEGQELVWDNNNRFDNAVDGDFDFGDWSDEGWTVSDLSVDPLYVDQDAGDYTLSESSPLIDAGHEDILDADGSVSDIGAFGGPEAW